MNVQDIVQQAEALTGIPVHISRDPALGQMSAVQLARGPLRLHHIRIHPAHEDVADYLIAFQCGFILRKFGTPPEHRFDLAASRGGRSRVEALIGDHDRGKGLPEAVLRGFRDRLYDGLMLQLVSIPVSLRVDAWIFDGRPDLSPQQKTAITRQLQENLATLKPEIKQMAPEEIVRPSLSLNAAFATFWSRRWDDPLVSMPYRSAGLGASGVQLIERFEATPPGPEHDRALIDAWASELGLSGWYDWVPYSPDDE